MNSRNSRLKGFVYLITFFVLCAVIYSSSAGVAFGQKKPNALKLDTNTDDKQYCGETATTEFCALYFAYMGKTSNQKPTKLAGKKPTKDENNVENPDGNDVQKPDEDIRKAARDEMIEVVRGQVDTYYKLRKDGRKTNIRWLQTLLDFLEIGTAGAIAIMNGERDKTVTGIALNIFQGGRTSFNRNFEILQTQVLINKMNSNRAEILTEILENKKLDTGQYSWYAAKNDLRRYMFAGTFNNALDTLVDETGAEVVAAEKALREVGPQKLTTAATLSDADLAERAAPIKKDLRKKLKGTEKEKEEALKRIKAIVTALEADDALQKLLEGQDITSDSSDGEKILNALRDIIIAQTREGRAGRDIVAKINRTFIEESKETGGN